MNSSVTGEEEGSSLLMKRDMYWINAEYSAEYMLFHDCKI